MPLLTISDLERETPERVARCVRYAQDLRAHYDAFIEHDDSDVSFEVCWNSSAGRARGLHASELSGCPRPAVYSLLGTERRGRVPPFWRQRFQWGHLVHAKLQSDFERLAQSSRGRLSFERELPIAPELQELAARWDIHSRGDGAFTFFEPKRTPMVRLALEIKSKSDGEFEKIVRQGPTEQDLDQITVYMACLDLPLGWLLYANKSNQNICPSDPPYLVLFDAERWARLENTMALRHDDARASRLPERIEGPRCEFCPFSWTCAPPYLARKARVQAAKEARDSAARVNPHRRALRVAR